jgi:hypothetical protein
MAQGRHFETGDELFAAIMDLTGTIEKGTLERVFLELMDSLAKYISTTGNSAGGNE